MRFDDRISKSGFRLLTPEPNPGGEILLAERMINDADYGPVWEMLYAIKREKEDMGQTILVRADDPYAARRNAAIKAAETFITDSIAVGRLKAH